MKNYRKRAAESFRSGIESPLEALGTRALREAQAELQHKAAESDDRDPDALALLDEALAHEPRDAHERRAAARAYLGVTTTRTKRAVRVERVATKNNERDVWTSWVNVGFPIADKMMRAAIAERLESERITEDEGQELLDLLDAIGANSSNDKIEPDYYEDLVADMRELGDRTTAMDWGNNFPYENWHRDADELEKYGDGLRDWYGDDWKSAPASRTKAFADRDELALALREWSDEASDAEDEALATGLSDAARLVENGDLREAVDAILDSVPDGPDSEKATGMIQDFINESKSAGAVETKKRGGDPYRDFTKVLVKLSKGYRDVTSLMTAEAFDDAKANDPDLYAVMGEIEDVMNFMGDIHSVDGWAVDDVMATVNELKGKLDSFDVEDPSLQAAIDAVVYNWDAVIPELETAIEAIDAYEDSY